MAVLSAAAARADWRCWLRSVATTWGLSSVLLVGATPGLASQATRVPEYQLKAVFLLNFAQFVEPPPEGVPDSAAPLIIGILGDDPFGGVLDATVHGEHRGERAFAVRRYQRVEDIGACDILFISQSENDQIGEILASLGTRPILTVSDGPRFAERGGMIHFVTDRNRIRLRINLGAAQAANLTISSKLLRVSDIVASAGR